MKIASKTAMATLTAAMLALGTSTVVAQQPDDDVSGVEPRVISDPEAPIDQVEPRIVVDGEVPIDGVEPRIVVDDAAPIEGDPDSEDPDND